MDFSSKKAQVEFIIREKILPLIAENSGPDGKAVITPMIPELPDLLLYDMARFINDTWYGNLKLLAGNLLRRYLPMLQGTVDETQANEEVEKFLEAIETTTEGTRLRRMFDTLKFVMKD